MDESDLNDLCPSLIGKLACLDGLAHEEAAVVALVPGSFQLGEKGLAYCKLVKSSGEKYSLWTAYNLLLNAARLRHEAEPLTGYSSWLTNESGIQLTSEQLAEVLDVVRGLHKKMHTVDHDPVLLKKMEKQGGLWEIRSHIPCGVEEWFEPDAWATFGEDLLEYASG